MGGCVSLLRCTTLNPAARNLVISRNPLTPFTFLALEYQFNNIRHLPAEGFVLQTMTWDDHDIFDGWGSYPDTLQNCPVFQGCYQAARRFYLLFQQHTTLQRVGETDMFGHRCVAA